MNKILFSLLLFLMTISGFSQSAGENLIDSLQQQIQKAAPDTNKVKLLIELSNQYPYTNPDEGINKGSEALELATKLSWQRGIAGACAAMGGNYVTKADYAHALEYDYRALKIYEELKDVKKQAQMLRYIGIAHHTSRNQEEAIKYDEKALHLYETLHDSGGIAGIYGNMSNAYYSMRDKDHALEYDMKALNIYNAIHDKEGEAMLIGNIGNLYAFEGDFPKAMVYYFEAVRRETALGNKSGVTRNMGNIGETYLDIARDTSGKIQPDSLIPAGKAANLKKAIEYLKNTIQNAKELQQTEYILAFAEVLSEAYRLSGNTEEALKIYQEYILVRDSVYDVEKYNALTRKKLDYEYGKREDSIQYQKQLSDVKLQEEKRTRARETVFYIAGLALVILFSIFMFNRWRVTQKQKGIIEQEQKRSEELLLNILPAETARELKQTGQSEARMIDSVTVLFTDFKGFTNHAERLSAQELVAEINECFSAFDRIVEKYGVEKIKTIGDSYMAAGGVPIPNQSHAQNVVNAALEINQFMANRSADKKAQGKVWFEIRIGVHTGSVVAGIVGIRKFQYDIWGDTVNIASRMESSSEAGKVNISATTYELVRHQFNCISRGKIEAKNKGELEMYFVEGQK
jgi:adenylate cyclase